MKLVGASWSVVRVVGLLAATAPVAAQEPVVTAFVHVAVIPMDRERVLPDQTVLVRGNRIVALGPAAKVRVPAGAQQIDGRGKYLLPGLADMHAHVGDTVGLLLYLANGVTTLRDLGGRSSLTRLRELRAGGALAPPRLYGVGKDGCGEEDLSKISKSSFAACLAALKAAGYDLYKLGPTVAAIPQLFDSVFLPASQQAGFPLGGHIFPGPGIERALQARYRSIEHLFGYLDFLLGYRPSMLLQGAGGDTLPLSTSYVWRHALKAPILAGIVPSVQASYLYDGSPLPDTMAWLQPGYRLDPQKLRAIAVATKRAGTWNVPTLVQLEVTGAKPQDGAKWVDQQHFELKLQIVKALHDAGAGLLLSTDFPGGPGVPRELALLVQAGLTPYQALVTGTRNVAVYLGTQDSAGTVAVGKYADLVLLDKNPLQDIRNVRGPAGVMADGRWLSRAELEAHLGSLKVKP